VLGFISSSAACRDLDPVHASSCCRSSSRACDHKLLRAQLALILCCRRLSCRVVRGGLQAIPREQLKRADALGLAYWQRTATVICAGAAHRVPLWSIPFHRFFKDTSLVVIIACSTCCRNDQGVAQESGVERIRRRAISSAAGLLRVLLLDVAVQPEVGAPLTSRQPRRLAASQFRSKVWRISRAEMAGAARGRTPPCSARKIERSSATRNAPVAAALTTRSRSASQPLRLERRLHLRAGTISSQIRPPFGLAQSMRRSAITAGAHTSRRKRGSRRFAAPE